MSTPERTLVLVKPDAYARGLLSEVTRRLEATSLDLVAMKMVVPSRKQARAHFAMALADDDGDDEDQAAEAALDASASFLSSGPVVATVWEGPRAVGTALALAGAEDPQAAEAGTIRGDLAHARDRNLVDVSPDDKAAKRQIGLWFKAGELAVPAASGAAAAAGLAASGPCQPGAPPPPGVRLPRRGARNILVTSALPYVNNVPHLGNIIGCVLSADVYARYMRQRGTNVIYMCGTDEYGTATEVKALSEGLSPQQICDKYHAIHAQVYEWFDIQFDHFGRTSTPYQTEIAQSIFMDCHERGFLLKKTTQQLYSEALGKFLADRFVSGTCPHCGYDDARGDQCDQCGKLLNPTELINPRCTASGTTPVTRSTDHMYLDLPTLTEPLVQWIDKTAVDGFWTNNAISTTQTWIKGGLQPRCITRDLKWGVPVPLKGMEHKVFYVWFDAPIGYISITAGYAGEGWREWWHPKEDLDVKLVQFMAKDNIPFHTVVFPASLIASGRPWLTLHHIAATEYLNYEDGKFSKSRSTGVFGDAAKDTGISVAVFRYYLLANRPETADSAFKWSDLAAKNNTELLANLGNFVNRAVTFTKSKFGGLLPRASLDGEAERKLVTEVNEQLKAYHAALEAVSLKEGLRLAMAISRLGNVYLQEGEPWKKMKTDPAAAGGVCTVAINLCRLIAVVFEPYMGSHFASRIFKMLGVDHGPETNGIPDTFELTLPEGHKLGEPELLFRTIPDDEVAALQKRFGGSQEDAAPDAPPKAADLDFPADMRVGQVAAADAHPEDTERLWVLQVNLGSEQRQVVAGLRAYYPDPTALVGRNVVVLCNLKPVALRGVESQGMVLCGAKKEDMGLLCPPPAASPGARVFAGELRNPGEEPGASSSFTYPTLELKEFQKLPLTVGAGLGALFKKKHALCVDGQPVLAENVPEGAKIK